MTWGYIIAVVAIIINGGLLLILRSMLKNGFDLLPKDRTK